jgi:hypothetical protein
VAKDNVGSVGRFGDRSPLGSFVSNSDRVVQWRTAPQKLSVGAAVLAKTKDFAPYVAMLFLPGGALMAFLLWLYRRQKRAAFLATQ